MSQHIHARLVERVQAEYEKAQADRHQAALDLEDLLYLQGHVHLNGHYAMALSDSAKEQISKAIDLSERLVPLPGVKPDTARNVLKRFISNHTIECARAALTRAELKIKDCESLLEELANMKED